MVFLVVLDSVVVSVPLGSKRRMYTYILLLNFGRSALLTANTPTNLDVMEVFYECKSVRFSIGLKRRVQIPMGAEI